MHANFASVGDPFDFIASKDGDDHHSIPSLPDNVFGSATRYLCDSANRMLTGLVAENLAGRAPVLDSVKADGCHHSHTLPTLVLRLMSEVFSTHAMHVDDTVGLRLELTDSGTWGHTDFGYAAGEDGCWHSPSNMAVWA